MEFKKYQHVERFGTQEVDGIELGTNYVFPKIDGTNASIWTNDDGSMGCGSRNRSLTLDKDNAGFMNWATQQVNIYAYLEAHSGHRLYGEWLVPHSLKTYREDTWQKFYVFDIMVEDEYISYDNYKEELDFFGIDYIPPMCIIKNGSYDQFVKQLENNVFLVKDGEGCGEGIVIKNYGYKNKYGRITWAKIVTSEFKEKHTKTMGGVKIEGKKMIEEEIIDNFCTEAFIKKEYEKIKVSQDGWSSKMIPRLLGTIYHEFIVEESWNFIKKYKYPTVNYKTLNHFLVEKIKSTLTEIF